MCGARTVERRTEILGKFRSAVQRISWIDRVRNEDLPTQGEDYPTYIKKKEEDWSDLV